MGAATLVRGVAPVLAVPFRDDGEVDVDGFRAVVANVLATGVTSVLFPGFASEFHKLADAERAELTRILLDHTSSRADVAAILAVQDHATHLAVRRATDLAAAGADLINLLPPHFGRPSSRAVRQHIEAVLDAVPNTPVVVQHAPALTGTALDPKTIAEIARNHPNLRFVKVESTPPGPFITALRAALGAEAPAVRTLVGYAGVQLPDAVRRGAVGVQPGCSFTEVYVRIWDLFEAGNVTEADELHRRLLPYISYWMSDSELIVAAEKLISQRRGWFGSAHCRAPSRELDSEEIRTIERFLAEFEPFWHTEAG